MNLEVAKSSPKPKKGQHYDPRKAAVSDLNAGPIAGDLGLKTIAGKAEDVMQLIQTLLSSKPEKAKEMKAKVQIIAAKDMRADMAGRVYQFSERMGKAGKEFKSNPEGADKALDDSLGILRSPSKLSHSLDAILEQASKKTGNAEDLAELLTAKAGETTARDNPQTFQRTVERTLHSLEAQLETALRNEDMALGLALLQAMHRIEREYKDDLQPLVKLLGHKRAIGLWRDRSSRLNGISEAQWQTLLDTARGGKFSETLAEIQAKSLRYRQERQERGSNPASPTPAPASAKPGNAGSPPAHCILCGKRGHWAATCRVCPELAAKVGAKRASDNNGQAGNQKRHKKGNSGHSNNNN